MRLLGLRKDANMTIVSLQEAQADLGKLVRRLTPGEVVTIIDDNGPVAQLIPVPKIVPRDPLRPRPPVTGVPMAGRLKGKMTIADDFDEPLEELREYME